MDLAFIYLVVAMFLLSEEAENGSLSDDGVVIDGEPSEHDVKITNKIIGLKKRLIKTIKQNKKHVAKVKPFREMLLKRMIECENSIIQLDYLALHIISQRFSTSRTEKLHDRLQWLQKEEDDLISVLNLLDKTAVAGRDGEMEKVAAYIVGEN